MSKHVDVLEEIDAVLAQVPHNLAEKRDNLREVRAVVAELMELALQIDVECGNSKPRFGRVVALASKAGALARAGGAL